MNYPHTLTITRTSETGSADSETGIFTPSGSNDTIYSGACDAQEVSGLSYSGASLKEVRADLAVFLEDELKAFDVKVGDVGSLIRGSQSRPIVVRKVRILDAMIEADITG
jgi:hypothetical protein